MSERTALQDWSIFRQRPPIQGCQSIRFIPWSASGRIPYVKVGRLVKFDLVLLDAWIKQKTIMPMPDIGR